MTSGVRQEDGPGGLPFLVVETDRCRARLTPHGAQVCEWTPAGQPSSVLFLSPRAVFGAGSAIRGGVPVCFPWFAAHASDSAKPAHGFARTRPWRIGDITRDEMGDVRIVFHLATDRATRALWDSEFAASLTVALGRVLAMTFEVENTGAADMSYEIALHSYLAVGDVAQTRVHGLERTRFIDKVDGMREHVAGDEPVTFTGEVDRIFVDTAATCLVDDPILARRLRIEKAGSPATVVWNPGPQKGPAVSDLGESWRHFVCVETAICRPHAALLSPGARHALTARISVDESGAEGRAGGLAAPGSAAQTRTARPLRGLVSSIRRWTPAPPARPRVLPHPTRRAEARRRDPPRSGSPRLDASLVQPPAILAGEIPDAEGPVAPPVAR